jgi:hypothetical protein
VTKRCTWPGSAGSVLCEQGNWASCSATVDSMRYSMMRTCTAGPLDGCRVRRLTAIGEDLLHLPKLIGFEAGEAMRVPLVDQGARAGSAETTPRSSSTSIPSCTERLTTTGAKRCSLTRQGAKTASTMAWVPTSGRREAAHLRKGTDVLATAQASKVAGIGRRIGYFIQGTIASHQTQAEAEGAFGLGGGHRSADVLEHMAHHGCVQLPAPVDQRSRRWQS